jgi:hypothetical protein
VIERVASVVRGDVPLERTPEQPEVAHQVEHLVPDEFVLEAQAVVEDRALAHHHGVVQRAATGETVLPHHRNVSQEPVGAGGRQLFHERALTHLEGRDLKSHHGMGIVERVGNPERVGRRDLEPAAVVADANRLADRHRPARDG